LTGRPSKNRRLGQPCGEGVDREGGRGFDSRYIDIVTDTFLAPDVVA
jgi:hypothetical protein